MGAMFISSVGIRQALADVYRYFKDAKKNNRKDAENADVYQH